MKQIIELTKEQIDVLTKASKEKLESNKKKELDSITVKYTKEIAGLEAKYEKAVKELENKFKTFSITIDDTTSTSKNESNTVEEFKRINRNIDQKIFKIKAEIKKSGNTFKTDTDLEQAKTNKMQNYLNAGVEPSKAMADDLMEIYNKLKK